MEVDIALLSYETRLPEGRVAAWCTDSKQSAAGQNVCALQTLQDILDDDDDIGSMYLSRKARAKQQSQANTSNTQIAPKGGSDDEVLVARGEEVKCLPLQVSCLYKHASLAEYFLACSPCNTALAPHSCATRTGM